MPKNIEQKVGRILTGPVWRAKEIVDDRRRRSFYYLLSFTIIFGLLLIINYEDFSIPGIQIKLKREIAISIGPVFILITYLSYLYLCSLTLEIYMKYLRNFIISEPDVAEIYSFIEIYNLLKRRDVTERLNPFCYSESFLRNAESKTMRAVGIIASKIYHCGILLIIFVPALLYFALIWGIFTAGIFHSTPFLGSIFLFSYGFLSFGFVIGPLVLWNRNVATRSYYYEMIIVPSRNSNGGISRGKPFAERKL